MAGLLMAASAFAAPPAPGDFFEADALLVQITEKDLNRILVGAILDWGGPTFAGQHPRVSDHVFELSYEALVADPIMRIEDNRRLRLDLQIAEADVRVGRLERKILHRMAHCENTGVTVDATDPVQVGVGLTLAIEDGDLRVRPNGAWIENAEDGFRLVKPSRCRKALMPKWLLWWIGKPHLRRMLDELDQAVLKVVRDGTEDLASEDAILKQHWQIGSINDGDHRQDLFLVPTTLSTERRVLFFGLAASSHERAPADGTVPGWVPELTQRSFLALSESVANRVVSSAFSGAEQTWNGTGENLGRAFRSTAINTLIPGIRNVADRDKLRFGFRFREAPRVEFLSAEPTDAHPEGAALIRLRFAGVELEISGSQGAPLGTLAIDAATVTARPYTGVLGGVSFELVDNTWNLSSDGIEFNEEILAAALQEITFGTMFETTYEPVARNALRLGNTKLEPSGFDVRGEHLIIDLVVSEDASQGRVASGSYSQANR